MATPAGRSCSPSDSRPEPGPAPVAILEFYRGRAAGFEQVRHVWMVTGTHERAFKVAWAGVRRRPGDVVIAGCGVDRVVTDDAGQIVAAWNEFTMPS